MRSRGFSSCELRNEPSRAQIRGWPAECTCPPLQHQARPCPQDNKHRRKSAGQRTREVTLDPRRPLRTLRSEDKGQAGACPDRTRAIPCNVRHRAISSAVQLRAINQGDKRAITVTPGIPSCLASGISGHDLSNSQADSAGPIPGERFSCKTIGHSNYHRGNSMSAQAASHNVLTVTRMLFRPEGTGGQNQKLPLPSSPGKPCQSPGMPSCSFPASSTART